MSARVIMIGHRKRSGKDTVAALLADMGNVEIMRFADPMKRIVSTSLGCTLGELEQWKNDGGCVTLPDGAWVDARVLLQRFGTEAMKPEFGDSVWVGLLNARANASKADFVVVPDFRFPCELLPGAVTVYVDRPDLPDPDDHISERALEGYAYDYVVLNDGTLEDLRLQVESLARLLGIAGYGGVR